MQHQDKHLFEFAVLLFLFHISEERFKLHLCIHSAFNIFKTLSTLENFIFSILLIHNYVKDMRTLPFFLRYANELIGTRHLVRWQHKKEQRVTSRSRVCICSSK